MEVITPTNIITFSLSKICFMRVKETSQGDVSVTHTKRSTSY